MVLLQVFRRQWRQYHYREEKKMLTIVLKDEAKP
jgi:hypothetical protein